MKGDRISCGDSRESHSPPALLDRGPHILLTHREVRWVHCFKMWRCHVNWVGNWWGGSILAVTRRLDKKIPPEIRLWKWWLEWNGRDGKAREMAVKRKHQWGDYNEGPFAMWPWSSSLLSLFLSFLICTTESNRVVIRIQQISICSAVCDCTKWALKELGKCSVLGLFQVGHGEGHKDELLSQSRLKHFETLFYTQYVIWMRSCGK